MSQEFPDTTIRFDLYGGVHKALRAFLADTLTTVGRLDPQDSNEVAEGLAGVRQLLTICRDHLHHENQFIHPAMEARAPQSSSRTTDDHVHHEEAFEKLETQVLTVEQSRGVDQSVALRELYRGLSVFVAENYEHMLVEEIDNQKVLWETYSDAELASLHKTVVSAVPPQYMSVYMRWMIPYLSAPERAGLLNGIRATAPAVAFEQLLQVAESRLSSKDWDKLVDALNLRNEQVSVLN